MKCVWSYLILALGFLFVAPSHAQNRPADGLKHCLTGLLSQEAGPNKIPELRYPAATWADDACETLPWHPAEVGSKKMAAKHIETIKYEWDGASWIPVRHSLNTYNQAGNITEILYQNGDGIAWENDLRFLSEYDDHGILVHRVDQAWANGVWQNSYQYFHSYSAQGYEIEILAQRWNVTDWLNDVRWVDAYDADGRLVEEILIWWGSSGWYNGLRTSWLYNAQGDVREIAQAFWLGDWETSNHLLYSYDAQGQLTEILFQNRIDGVWINDRLERYTYDVQGNLLETTRQEWGQNAWHNDSHTLSMYNAQGQWVSLIEQEADANGDWIDTFQDLISYDEEGNLVEEINQIWDDGSWVNEARTVHVYEVAAVNAVPLAEDDAVATDHDTPVVIDVLANDNDPDGDALTLTIVTPPAHGTASINPGKQVSTITYTPNTAFIGIDAFTYQIDDARGGTDEATVTITVTGTAGPAITSPADGAQIILGGAPGEPPLDPETVFSVKWNAINGATGYTWELATADGFESNTILLSANVGTVTQFETTLGVLAALLDQQGVLLGVSLTLWHRVVVSDGQHQTPGSASQVTFVRGTLVALEEEAAVPTTYYLAQNYPNPFNPRTTIRFSLPQSGPVRMAVYDVLGREVALLVEAALPAGRHEAVFEANDLPSGVYLYRLEAGGRVLTNRMLFLK